MTLAFGLAAGTCIPARGQGLIPSDTAPAAFKSAWSRAVNSLASEQETALSRLATEREWEPYFRAAYNATTDQKLRNLLRPALIKCQADLFTWNLERAKTWAKELRFDYLADLAAATDDKDRAAILAAHVIQMQQDIYHTYLDKDLAPWTPKTKLPRQAVFLSHLTQDYAAWSGQKGFREFSGDRVEIPGEQFSEPAFIYARSGNIAANKKGACSSRIWICLSSASLTDTGSQFGMSWVHSVVSANDGVTIANAYKSLLVFDGDVELKAPVSEGSLSGTVVVANGDVVIDEPFNISAMTFIYAAGDVRGAKYLGMAAISAGGKFDPLPDVGKRAKFLREGQKENPLGIKFVSPADAGVELDVGTKVVRLGTLQATSPAAKAGLEKGDRVLTLNGVKMETAADFRRQLRESLLWGTGLFEIKRGDQTFLRLVKFAEPPKK